MSLFDYRPGELSLLLNPTAAPDVYAPPPPQLQPSLSNGGKRARDSSATQHDRASKKLKPPAASVRPQPALAQQPGVDTAQPEKAGEDDDDDDEQQEPAADADAESELSDLSDADEGGLYEDMDAATARQLRRERRLREDEQAETEAASSSRQRLSSSHSPAADPRLPRTLFVGNVSVSCTRKALCRVFAVYGRIESCRFRSFAADNPKLSKKVAVIRRAFHPQRQTLNAYIVYEQEDSVTKALAANGSLLLEHRLRVDHADRSRQRTAADSSSASRRSVFVGNLPFSASEEQLQSLFSSCGAVADVRLVRDAQLSLGKGFGFVVYEEEQSVRRALAMKGVRLDGRELRVSRAMDDDRLRQQRQQRERQRQSQQQRLTGAARRVLGKEKHGQRRSLQQQRLSASAASSSPALSFASPAAGRRRVIGAVSDPQQFMSQQRRLAKKQKARKEERRQKRSLVRTKKPRRKIPQAAGSGGNKATVSRAREGSSRSSSSVAAARQ